LRFSSSSTNMMDEVFKFFCVLIVWGRPYITSSNEGEGVTPLMTFDNEGRGLTPVDVITTILGKLLYSLLNSYIILY
jgi:hypothetical protein